MLAKCMGSSLLTGRRILIIVENLPVPFDRRVWQEAKALLSAGAEVCVICPAVNPHLERYEFREGVHIYRHPLPLEANNAGGYVIEYLAALLWESILAWKILFKHGFDTVHGCNPPDLIFLVALQFKLLGKRFIFDHHDINPELYEAKFNKRDFMWRVLRTLEWVTFKTADMIISVNDSYKTIAIERGGRDPKDVHIVRSGPDLNRIRSVPPNSAHKNGRPFLVAYVGVMAQQEGIDLLLEAVRHIVTVKRRVDIQFVLVGSGPAAQSLKQLSKKWNLDEYVTFAGRAPDEELLEILSTADVCVNPDRVNAMNDKSTMNKVLEYMAMSKAQVQFDVTEGRVSAGESSLYAKANDPIDFADQVLTLLEDPEKREWMGKVGRKRIEMDLAWSYQIPKLINAYASLK
jgi:glycosyltransferase involved in cell wall biosynthesis